MSKPRAHDTRLPPMPEPTMQEANPYEDAGAMNPYPGKSLLEWFTAEQMHAYAQSHAAAHLASLEAAEKDAERLVAIAREALRLLDDVELMQGSANGPTIRLRAVLNGAVYKRFNPDAPCSPFLTQCPRCNNPHNACDHGATRKEGNP